MTTGSSTLRSAVDPTVAGLPTDSLAPALQQLVETEWRESGQVDLVASMQRHPHLLRNRSLLLNLAVEEFRAHRRISEISDLRKHCSRFREFGGSVERSILRQLEAQRYVDDNFDLNEYFSQPTWPQPGDEFGGFYVVEELGVGSIARVYLCLQRDVGDRRVVVKATPYSDVEASILGRLEHPQITPIYFSGFVEHFNLHYLCMPFCGRSTLADVLDVAFESGVPRRDTCIRLAAARWNREEDPLADRLWQRLSVRLASRTYVDGILDLAVQLAGALDHAHRHGILHGDLKPSNVLLTPNGQPLLVDFNLSQDHASSRCRCGGTLPYMPPEHLQIVAGSGEAQALPNYDVASDIYSFGALLYELLVGASPVVLPEKGTGTSEAAKSILDQLEKGVPSVKLHNNFVSRRLESIVVRCLAFNPSDRPASMAEVGRMLRAEARLFRSLGRRTRTRPILFSIVAAFSLCLICGTGAYFAVQPPPHLAAYERAVEFVTTGDLNEAIAYFNESLEIEPSFAAARFQRGRAYIELGELDLAMNDFGHLAHRGDARCMAYLAYCFNLKRVAVAAIPWYDRAIRNGVSSMPIYNNLGASYLAAQTHVTREEQFRLAEFYLSKASNLDSSSASLRLNSVRLAAAKSGIDPSYDPFPVWEHAAVILAASPEDRVIRDHVRDWYHAVLLHEARINKSSRSETLPEERAARQEFAKLQHSISIRDKVRTPLEFPGSKKETEPPPESRYFLDPLWHQGEH